MFKIAYHTNYTHKVPENHRFPMIKYELLYEQLLLENYKPQNRQYKNTQIEKSLKTPINKGIEAKKPQNRDKTKCTITTI